jgi:hypothetical protein
MPRMPRASRRHTTRSDPRSDGCRPAASPPEVPSSVHRSLGSSRVAYKAAATPCLGTQDPPATGRAVRRRQAGLPRRARIPSAACPTAVPSTLSRACCCSPARSLLSPSRRLAGAGLPAAAARLCRGVPLPAQPRLQPSPQTGRRRVPSHPPSLPRSTRAAGSPDFGRNRRRPPRGTQLRASSYFQGLSLKVRAYL